MRQAMAAGEEMRDSVRWEAWSRKRRIVEREEGGGEGMDGGKEGLWKGLRRATSGVGVQLGRVYIARGYLTFRTSSAGIR